MNALWYVIKIANGLGERIEPGHLEECDAYAQLVDLAANDDANNQDVEYQVEHRSTHPTAYCLPRQARR